MRALRVALLTFALVLGLSAPAHALVTNIVPLNGSQDPIAGDTIQDNEDLYAYVTSPSGGVACMHPATDLSGPTCSDAGTFARTPVLPLSAYITPVTAGKLTPGKYVMIAADTLDSPATAVSASFFVEPCSLCSALDPGKGTSFLSQMNAMLDVLDRTCSLLGTAQMLWHLKPMYDAAFETFAAGPPIAMGPVVTMGAAANAAIQVGQTALPGPLGAIAAGICDAAGGTPFSQATKLAKWVERWVDDPPDPNYTTIASPGFIDYSMVPGVPLDGLTATRTDLDKLRAYTGSSITAFERYQGAKAANAAPYVHSQIRAVGDDLFNVSHGLFRAANALNGAAAQLRVDHPAVQDRTVSQADIDTADTLVDRVRASGFTASELTALQGIGLSATTIGRLRADVTGRDPGALTGPLVLDETLDALATAMRDVTESADDFAREALVAAGRNNIGPQAHFSAARKSGSFTTFRFTDTSTAGDLDPLVVSWDFGDGATADATAGEAVEHAFAPGSYSVSETVSDGIASSSTQRTITVGSAAPTVVTDAATSVGTKQATLHAIVDANGQPVTVRWQLGTTTAYGQSVDLSGQLLGTDPQGVSLETPATLTPDTTYHVRAVVLDEFGDIAALGDDATFTTDAAVHPPAVVADTLAAFPAGTKDVLANDSDPDDDALTVSANTQPAHGTVSCSAQGACFYTAASGYSGSDSFSYTARDAGGLTKVAAVAVTVTAPVSAAPLAARDDAASIRAGTTATVHVLANDSGPDISLTASAQPQHGTATCAPDGTCTYEPGASFSGTDGFTYTVTDDQANTSSAAVTIVVAPLDARHSVSASGAPVSSPDEFVPSGGRGLWAVGVGAGPAGITGAALGALPLPSVTTELSGPQDFDAATVRTAPGWTATTGAAGIGAAASPDALLGEALTRPFPRPLPPISQGTGGDGHVPIVIGSRVFAFFHHATPTSVSCVDRATGARCPGYPKVLDANSSGIVGPAAVVGSRMFVHLWPASVYAQTAPIALYCWDAATDAACGLTIVDRVARTDDPGASAPVSVGGKVWFGADTGKLYCVDPATRAACAATPFITTGLGSAPADYDIVTHGSRVFVGRGVPSTADVACIDVAAGARCPGWSTPKTFDAANLVNQHDASGAAVGVCVFFILDGECIRDDSPGTRTAVHNWLDIESGYSTRQEAEAGTRTFVGSALRAGVGCYDWSTMAPCTGGGWGPGGWLSTASGTGLPLAYGATYDGSCIVALGDPGQVFTVDPAGSSPCVSLGSGAERTTIDLRDQRCDGGVGGAGWTAVKLADAEPGELSSVVVTVRDALSGAPLKSGDLVGSGGTLDLTGIDPVAHPSIAVDARAVGVDGKDAWADGIPPRIEVTWHADPRQLCVETVGASACADASPSPLALIARLGGPAGSEAEAHLGLRRGTCPVPPAGRTAPVAAAGSPPKQPVTAKKPRRCTGARLFQIRLRYDGAKARSVAVTVGGKRQKVLRMTPRPVVSIDLRGLPVQTTKVKIAITTRSGKVLRGVRVYHPCKRKLPDRGFKY